MLRLTDDFAVRAEAAVAKPRRRDSNPVHIARRHTGRTGKADEQGIQVAALAAKVTRLQHRLDVAPAAAADLGITEGIVHDPFIDGARFLNVSAGALGNRARGIPHDAVGWKQLGRLQVQLENRRVFLRYTSAACHIHGAIPGSETADQRQPGRFRGFRKYRMHHAQIVFLILRERDLAALRVPAVAQALLIIGIGDQWHRQPDLRHACRLQDLDISRHLKGAPLGTQVCCGHAGQPRKGHGSRNQCSGF